MILFTWIGQIIIFIFVTLRRLLATFVLSKLMGWKITRSYNAYFQYRKGRHIIIYAHTSVYDDMLGYLMCIMYDIPMVGVGKKELTEIFILGWFMRQMNMIFIDRKKNTNTTQYISNALDKYKNFVFVIAPEGTRNKVDDIKSGFYYIGVNTRANLHIAKIDYSNQMISVDEIASDIELQTSNYDQIKKLVVTEMKKEKPYCPDQCHLIEDKSFRTSLINVNRSWLIYLPPFIVFYIMITTIHNYFCIY